MFNTLAFWSPKKPPLDPATSQTKNFTRLSRRSFSEDGSSLPSKFSVGGSAKIISNQLHPSQPFFELNFSYIAILIIPEKNP
jgi:hypothetical protein